MASTEAGLVLTTVAVAGVCGAVAGRGLRALLARLRRGARAPAGVCEAAVAAAVAAPAVAAALGLVDGRWAPLWAGVGVLTVAVAVTDLAHRRIPNALTGPALPLLLLLTAPLGGRAVLAGLLGAAAALLVFGAVHLLAPQALGAGDVKLAAVLGVPLAAGSWWALVATPVLAAGLVVVTAVATRQRSVALGPLLAGVAWLLVGVIGTAGPP